MTITVKPLAAPLGAEVFGVDPTRPLTDAEFAILENAMLEHLAIVISDLPENLDWLLDLGRRCGPLVPHVLSQYHHPYTSELSIIASNMDSAESRRTAKPAGAFWHSDLSYTAKPSDAIFLYSTIIPDDGGETDAANMYLAYDALPAATKARIADLRAVHRYGWNGGGAIVELTPEQRARYPDVVHPVVRVHPRTGRKCLFVSPGYTMCIVGLPQDESDALLEELFAHQLRPEFQYTHRWQVNQLVALDNRATIHRAVAGYTKPLRMLRMIVDGTA